jgi:hypothetical protein
MYLRIRKPLVYPLMDTAGFRYGIFSTVGGRVSPRVTMRSTFVEKTTSRNAPTQKAAVLTRRPSGIPQGANLVEVSQRRPKMEGGGASPV